MAQATMAPSKDDTKSEDSYVSEDSDMNQPDTNDRAPKRRRLSESDEEDDEYVAPAPLPAVSRIKKKDETKKPEPTDEEDPVTIRDALEIGLRAEESTFGALNVSPWLVGSLTTMAIRRPTAIQKACIPEILKGRDCIGGSRTGSGKTMAFAVPIIQKWAQDPFGIFALVLTPTRYDQFAQVDGFHSNKLVFTNTSPLKTTESWLFRFSSSSRPSLRHRA
jgi:ATP-dependent RNA helicase DDX49/DBP8